MKPLCVVGALWALAGSAMAEPVTYTFDVTVGSMVFSEPALGSTSGGMTGTFAVTIYQSNGHIGESDTFILEDSDLYNSDSMALTIGGTTTANIYAGSARLLDFLPDSSDHIGLGGNAAADTDLYVSLTVDYTGGISTPVHSEGFSGDLKPFDMTFSTSVSKSDVLTATLAGVAHEWELDLGEGNVLTFDLLISAEGTAHVVPDPSLGGLAALGLFGGAAWLRRRRA